MALDLLKRAEKGSALTATEYDATLSAIETHTHPISELTGVDQHDLLGRTASSSGAPSGLAAGDLTEEATPAAGHFLAGWGTGGALRKFDVGDLPSGGAISVDQHDIVGRIAAGAGAASGLTAGDLTEETTPTTGHFLAGWGTGGALRKFDVGDLPTGTGIAATTAFGAGRTGENTRSLVTRIQDIINVKDFGAVGDGSTADRAAINEAIVYCNGHATPQRLVLYFPPGEYAVSGGVLTPADGDYSIIMDASATIFYTASSYNAVMWQIGNVENGAAVTNGVQRDGQGVLRFELAAEGGGAGQDYTQANNVAFEFINIKHFSGRIRRANEFFTGLRMTADANNAAVDRHMYDVVWELGYFHPCQHNLVQRTRGNGWMNNIRYYNGDFTGALSGARYLNMITEGTIGQSSRGGENKAVFYEPLCDSNNFTALYVRGATAMIHGGHMEGPDWTIEHEAGQASFAGDEPCVWIAPRLEAKQFLISDPDDVGSWAYDPFWGPGPTPRLKALTGSRSLSTGDVRRGAMLYNPGGSNWTVTIPDYGGGAQEPPLGAMVHFSRRSTGTLTVAAGSGAALLIPTGKTAVVAQGAVATAQLISLSDGSGNQLWHLYGGLVDA